MRPSRASHTRAARHLHTRECQLLEDAAMERNADDLSGGGSAGGMEAAGSTGGYGNSSGAGGASGGQGTSASGASASGFGAPSTAGAGTAGIGGRARDL